MQVNYGYPFVQEYISLGATLFPAVEVFNERKINVLNNSAIIMIFSNCKTKGLGIKEKIAKTKNAIPFANAHLLAFHLIKSTNSKYES